MNEVFVVRNQDGMFASKQKEWVDGREPKLLFRSPHHDEAINLVFEISSKDIYARAAAIAVKLGDNKHPIIEVTAPLPDQEESETGTPTDTADNSSNSDKQESTTDTSVENPHSDSEIQTPDSPEKTITSNVQVNESQQNIEINSNQDNVCEAIEGNTVTFTDENQEPVSNSADKRNHSIQTTNDSHHPKQITLPHTENSQETELTVLLESVETNTNSEIPTSESRQTDTHLNTVNDNSLTCDQNNDETPIETVNSPIEQNQEFENPREMPTSTIETVYSDKPTTDEGTVTPVLAEESEPTQIIKDFSSSDNLQNGENNTSTANNELLTEQDS